MRRARLHRLVRGLGDWVQPLPAGTMFLGSPPLGVYRGVRLLLWGHQGISHRGVMLGSRHILGALLSIRGRFLITV